MKFENVEEIKKWFNNHKYEPEVHSAIEFLVEKTQENEKKPQIKKPRRPKAAPLRTGI